MFRFKLFSAILSAFFLLTCFASNGQTQEWNNISAENKPWTRWWWHGNSVTKEGITTELESFHKNGFGGVELTPIFGVIGDERNFIEFLSKEWMDLFIHTLNEADRIGMLVDVATGTGWPFGGPWVSQKDACKYLTYQVHEVEKGSTFSENLEFIQEPIFRRIQNPVINIYEASAKSGKPISRLKAEEISSDKIELEDIELPIESNENMQKMAFDQVRFEQPLELITVMAYGEDGEIINLEKEVSDEMQLRFRAKTTSYKIYALYAGYHGKMVERAAPGGEGNVIDHFSKVAIRNYLRKFDQSFQGYDISSLRAFFNDSYEVDDARGQSNWTPWFFQTFNQKKGYELRNYLPALLDPEYPDQELRRMIIADYRSVYGELIEETFTNEWREWAHNYKAIIRNQSHGSPANILDLYAASDIPEAEGTQELRIKFASSAGHVSGKPLIAAEAATWLNEHFLSNLTDLKQNVDRYLIHGINHVVYHGTAYSPEKAIWPGRLFYAAIHANNRNPMWDALGTLNNYIARSQSILQAGIPDNDILLYYPAYDVFGSEGAELLKHFDGHGKELDESNFGILAQNLVDEGYAIDFISDKQVLNLQFVENGLKSNGLNYQLIIVPETTYMPKETLEKLSALAKNGAKIVFQNQLPELLPGMDAKSIKSKQFAQIKNTMNSDGYVTVSENIFQTLIDHQVRREVLVENGLDFIRRNIDGSTYYFITNWSDYDYNGNIELHNSSDYAVILDPMTGKSGSAMTNIINGKLLVYANLKVGETIIIKCVDNREGISTWPYFNQSGDQIEFSTGWETDFIEGGPSYPQPFKSQRPELWTSQPGMDYIRYSGLGEYTTSFRVKKNSASHWLLDLGEVYETAEIFLNGESLGTLIGPTYQIVIDGDKLKKKNQLRIVVANKMANRIIDLDKKKIYWKNFYNTNFPPRFSENRGELGLFDAASWDPLPSGIKGPVSLIGLNKIEN